MKRNYFLPALFVAAAFTACTQEDLVVNNATNDTFEVVGAKLLGDGFTADLNSVSATRVGLDESGNAKYVEGDKAGIGWVVGFILATKRIFPYLERGLEPDRGWINVLFVDESCS